MIKINLKKEDLINFAIGSELEEKVAFLVGRKSIIDTLWLANNEAHSEDFYIISSEQYKKALIKSALKGLNIYGVVHTHVGLGLDFPSEIDIENVKRFNPYNYRAVYHVDSGRLTLYNCTGLIFSEVY